MDTSQILKEEYEQAVKRGGTTYADHYCEGLEDGIKYPISKELWISVEDRPAPKDEWLMVYNGRWTGVAKRKTKEDEYEPEWHDEQMGYLHESDYPTHWRPLPAPPIQ